MVFELLWPVVIVVFVGCVFVLVTRLIGLALSEREAEWSGPESGLIAAPPPAATA